MLQTMNKYIRLTKGLNDPGILILENEINAHLKEDVDYYSSLYKYNEDHYKKFQETNTIAGIEDVETNKLIFDFDCKDNLEYAQNDAVEMFNRLKEEGIPENTIDIYFSGKKGFTISVELEQYLTPRKLKYLVSQIGSGLKTMDLSIYNASRIIRIPNTKHQDSGLYKIQLNYNQLTKLSIDYIKENAKKPSKLKKKGVASLSDETLKEEPVKELPTRIPSKESNVSLAKPLHWRDYKWSLLQGNFEKGERNNAMMVIASSCRAMGYDRLIAESFCKTSDEKHVQRTKDVPMDENSLNNQVLDIIYSETWRGCQYSPETNLWLKEYCQRTGIEFKDENKPMTVDIFQMHEKFKQYAEDYDKIKITTGIPPLDKKIRLTLGQVFTIVAAPGVGKTSIALQILNAMSKKGEQTIFLSYDMCLEDVFEKIVTKHVQNVDVEEVLRRYRSKDPKMEKLVIDTISTNYPNVDFNFDTGQSCDQIIQTIESVKRNKGKPVRLVILDYNELVATQYSDPTTASLHVAKDLLALAKNQEVCVLILAQPNKKSK